MTGHWFSGSAESVDPFDSERSAQSDIDLSGSPTSVGDEPLLAGLPKSQTIMSRGVSTQFLIEPVCLANANLLKFSLHQYEIDRGSGITPNGIDHPHG